jgi:uncharacterized membrane protein
MMEQVLRVATWTAAALLVAGLGLWLGGAAQAAFVLHAGLWLLIATPIARVIMAIGSYAAERDWTFVLLTAVVLACLVFPIVRYLAASPR